MGYLSALGMREHAGEDLALEWHLANNHFPPIPRAMLPVAVRALKYARAGRYDARVRLPAGITHRTGGRYATVAQLCEHMHLDAFLDASDGDA